MPTGSYASVPLKPLSVSCSPPPWMMSSQILQAFPSSSSSSYTTLSLSERGKNITSREWLDRQMWQEMTDCHIWEATHPQSDGTHSARAGPAILSPLPTQHRHIGWTLKTQADYRLNTHRVIINFKQTSSLYHLNTQAPKRHSINGNSKEIKHVLVNKHTNNRHQHLS